MGQKFSLLSKLVLIGLLGTGVFVSIYIDAQKKQSLPSTSTATLSPEQTPVKPYNQAKELPEIKVPIVLYHYVENVANPADKTREKLAIKPQAFEEQLQALQKENFDPVWVKDIPAILAGQEVLPAKPIALTFDDGYEDFYTDVFPLLKKYRTKATLYVVNDYIGRPDGYLNQSQIQEIIKSGLVEIGAHTLDHVNLPKDSADDAERQIITSKSGLEKEFHIKISTFAYPYGFYNDQIIKDVKNAGFTAAVIIQENNKASLANLFTLPRYRAGVLYPNVSKGLETINR